MPFKILGMWFRSLLSIAILGAAIYLIAQWYDHRQTVVSQQTAGRLEGSRQDNEDNVEVDLGPKTYVVIWQFGWNRETAFLLGGLALALWSLGGWASYPLMRRSGKEEPEILHGGTPMEIKRPDGSTLHVEIFGPEDGIPVVLTHGWGLDLNEWCYARKHLAGRYRLIVWDLPGLGKSTSPSNNDFSLENLARDLDQIVSVAKRVPVVLVGHSIGGMIILTYCRLFPTALGTRISSLVLAHTTYTNPVRTTSMPKLYTALQKPLLEPLCHLMIWLAPLVWLLNWFSYLNGSAHRSTERSSFSGRESRGQLKFLTRYYVTSWPAVVARGMLAMFRYDATETLRAISIPTLIFTGDQDKTCRPEASVFMADSIPNATLVRLEPARHCGLFEHHVQFDSTVAEFIGAGVSHVGQLTHS